MAIPEITPPFSYIEPDPRALESCRVDDKSEHNELHKKGMRIMRIIGKKAVYEPTQPGVPRYPVVPVQIFPDAARTAAYLNMGPTNWAETSFDPE